MQREKFQTAEQLWFWFVYSKSVQRGVMRNFCGASQRPCELIDVESLITKLYLSGRLTDEQLLVMKKFGDRRRAPNQHVWAEKRAADSWTAAMQTIATSAVTVGWIEPNGGTL